MSKHYPELPEPDGRFVHLPIVDSSEFYDNFDDTQYVDDLTNHDDAQVTDLYAADQMRAYADAARQGWLSPEEAAALKADHRRLMSAYKDATEEAERLRAKRDEAARRAEYWKGEHLAGNQEIDRLHAENESLRAVLREASSLSEIVRTPNAEYVADAHNKAVRALRSAIDANLTSAARPLLAAEHKGWKVDYSGLISQVRRALRGEPGLGELMRQLGGHLEELGRRWYAGDTAVVDEILQLYCIEGSARNTLAAAPKAVPQPATPPGDSLPREDFAWLVVQEACETEPADEDDPECIRILRRDLKSAVLAAFLRHDAARTQDKEGASHEQ